MTVFIFVRHGFSENNAMDILETDPNNKTPLTKEGVKQAEEVAEQLSKLKVSEIFSSPIYRAYETASIINKKFGLEIVKDQRLVDRNAGKMNKKSNMSGRWRLGLTDKEFESMLIETWQSMQKRIVSFVDSVKTDGVVIVATHEDVVKALISSILKLKEMQIFGLTVKNCSLTIIIRENGSYKLIGGGLPILTENMIKEIKSLSNQNK
jgi:2,3-bisphosphoglycerate-dependent phosphoglycerate mutase